MLSFHVLHRGQNSLGAEFQTSKDITEIDLLLGKFFPTVFFRCFPAFELWLFDSSSISGKHCRTECVSPVKGQQSSMHRK